MGPLPPLKPNCCPLSALPRREPRAGGAAAAAGAAARARPATRGLRTRKLHARLAAAPRPRHSPREHASTRAILGSRRPHDDAKSTASDDTASEPSAPAAPAPTPAPADEAGERLRQFLSEVYEDADFDALEPDPAHGAALPAAAAAPDVLGLVSDCDRCDIIRHHIRDAAAQRRATRRGRFKKKNRTGWPNKRKQKRGARADSSDRKTESSLDRSSVASADTRETDDPSGDDVKPAAGKLDSEEDSRDEAADADRPEADDRSNSDDKPLRLNVKVLLEDKKDKAKAEKVKGSSSVSESDEKEERAKKKKRTLNNLDSWLQPVVRVARVDPAAARRLRSAGAGARPRLR